MMNKRKCQITVYGCDDSTTIEIELTYDEYQIIELVANLITDASDYQCMPTMEIVRLERVPLRQHEMSLYEYYKKKGVKNNG